MNVFARIGGMVAPQIANLSSVWAPLSPLVFAGLAFSAVVVLMALPDTQGVALYETMAEAWDAAAAVSKNEPETRAIEQRREQEADEGRGRRRRMTLLPPPATSGRPPVASIDEL
jgi:hypothetical protein